MPRLDPAAQNLNIDRPQTGQSQTEYERTLNVNQSTISRLWNIFKQSGSFNYRPRDVRHPIATPGQVRYNQVFHLRNRTVSVSTTAVGIPGLRRISSNTVQYWLRKHGNKLRGLYFGGLLTPLHRSERVRW